MTNGRHVFKYDSNPPVCVMLKRSGNIDTKTTLKHMTQYRPLAKKTTQLPCGSFPL